MNTISEITPAKETWKLNRYTELILLDAKDDKIQASIPKYLISKFEKLIKEGGFYRFTNFKIEQNNEEFIATRHPYRLKFHKFTSPRPAENLGIPKYGFKLIPFAEFGTDKCYDKLLVDVIAEVLNVGDIVELSKNGQCTKRVIIHLLDFVLETQLSAHCGTTMRTKWLITGDQGWTCLCNLTICYGEGLSSF
ncbi:hypothetical protein OROMI_024595 [Orobanche minor]